MKETRDDLVLSTHPADQQPAAIHAYLTRSYWAEGIPLELVRRSLAHSLCFGVFDRGAQVAFARVVTDRATFAYLCDVYVLESHRGRGLASWMMDAIGRHPDLLGLRRFLLATRDAHGLYARHGFAAPKNPAAFMEISRPGLYKSTAATGRADADSLRQEQ